MVVRYAGSRVWWICGPNMPDPVVIITHCPLSAIVFVYVESSSVCVGFCVLLRISQSPMSGCLAQNRRNPRVSPSTQGLCLERGAGSILEPRPDSKIFTLSFSFSFSFPFFFFFFFFLTPSYLLLPSPLAPPPPPPWRSLHRHNLRCCRHSQTREAVPIHILHKNIGVVLLY